MMPHTVNLFYEMIISCVKLALKDSATVLETHNVPLIKTWELFFSNGCSIKKSQLLLLYYYNYLFFIHSFISTLQDLLFDAIGSINSTPW